MVKTVLTYYKGRDKENITVTNLIDDGKYSAYDASWADTTNTTIVISDESDIDTALVTVSGSNVVSVSATTIVFKSTALSSLARGLYVAKVIPGDGTDTWEGRFEMRVI